MSDREVLIGVTGGIAAYKTAALVSQLVQSGIGVSVAMTPAAEKFVGRTTFAALTGRPVATSAFDSNAFPLGAHISLAEQANVFCVAPATADFLAKAACGAADDLVSTLYLSVTAPTVFAPAMNCEMWEKAAVQRNVKQLEEDGVHLVGPDEGWLSCRKKGFGRMASPEAIFSAIQRILN